MLNLRVLLLEFIREPESDHRKARNVALRTAHQQGLKQNIIRVYLNVTFILDTSDLLRSRKEVRPTSRRAVHIAQNRIISTLLERTRKQARVLQIRKGNAAVTLKAKVDEVEVLRDDRSSRSREIERETIFDGTKVMQLEDEVLRKVSLVPPDDPADTDVGKTEFVA